MPTSNPRVNVTLSPSLDSLVCALAGLERVSKSTVIRDLLEAAEPSLRQALALMKAAEGASASARARVASDLEESVRAADGVQRLLLQSAAGHTRDMVDEAQAVKGRRPGAAPAGMRKRPPGVAPVGSKRSQNPPSSNRGVKS